MFELKMNYILVYVSYLLSTVVLNMLRPHRLKFQASLSLCLICAFWCLLVVQLQVQLWIFVNHSLLIFIDFLLYFTSLLTSIFSYLS